MNYNQAKKLIAQYLDDELEPKQLQEFMKILAISDELKKRVESYKKTWDVLGDLDDIEPAKGYVSRFWTRISQEKTTAEKITEFLQGFAVAPSFKPVLVTACVFLIVGFFSVSIYSQRQSTQTMLVKLNTDEIAMLNEIDSAEEIDIIADLEFYENFDIIDELDEQQNLGQWKLQRYFQQSV